MRLRTLEAALSLRLAVPAERVGPDSPDALAEALRSLVYAKTGVFLPPAHITVSESGGGDIWLKAFDIEVEVPRADAGSTAEQLATALVPWLPAFVTRELLPETSITPTERVSIP